MTTAEARKRLAARGWSYQGLDESDGAMWAQNITSHRWMHVNVDYTLSGAAWEKEQANARAALVDKVEADG